MSPKAMIWLSVTLSALAQIFLKHGLSQAKGKRRADNVLGLAVAVATQTHVWLWAGCFVVATALWLLGLQKLDLSYAYPLVAFGYILVAVLSWLFFDERVDGNRWLAVLVIGAGVMLIAGS